MAASAGKTASNPIQVDGGAGVDTLHVLGHQSDYVISQTGAGTYTLRESAGLGQNANLTGVEFIAFQDGSTLRLPTAAEGTGTFNPALQVAIQSVLRSADLGFATPLLTSVAAGTVTQSNAIPQIVHEAAATSSVATLSYEFFTGKVPSAAGMDYLVSPTGPNPNNLNSAYYQSFSLENRYINFAVNLGKAGDGAVAFNAKYSGLSLFEATRTAYATIFGEAPSDAKLHAILDPTTVLNGQTYTRADYFAYYGQDGTNGIGTKAAMVGYLLAEAEKADLGNYAKSNDAFLTDVALHNAPFAVDLIGVYNQPGFVFHLG